MALPDPVDLARPQEAPLHARPRQQLGIASGGREPLAEDIGRLRRSRGCRRSPDMFHVKHSSGFPGKGALENYSDVIPGGAYPLVPPNDDAA
ncbi:hypothetical protein MSEN_32520 [Mycolicibacter senuensis]|uniref:Uncharacterized protein n=1 Tax=Mycolicibacter senuensis TaxID=386913 RepID=A0A7I9XNH3_9MYCO|nr:hypothetical protein MSEN_32520 [Mycolicibacter senuensis]